MKHRTIFRKLQGFALLFVAQALLAPLVQAQSISFHARRDFTVGRDPRGVVVIDLTGDGKPDLATPNNNGSTSADNLSVLLNLGGFGTEQEPNEAPVLANTVALPGNRTGSAGRGDSFLYNFSYSNGAQTPIPDLFAFTLTQSARVELRLLIANSSADLELFLLRDEGGRLVQLDASDSFNVIEKIATGLLAPGRYLIGVGVYEGLSTYTLTATITGGPTITSLNPSSATERGSAFTLTVNGSHFANGASVRWNGSPRTTSFISSMQLTAGIAAADIANLGTAQVTVANPNGDVSGATVFTIRPVDPGRTVRVSDANGSPGGTVLIPIVMNAQGSESALSFSLQFDTAVLSNPRIVLGSGARDANDPNVPATLLTNANQIGLGRLGVIIALPPGNFRFAAGTLQMATVTFNIAPNPSSNSTTIGFTDQPVRRAVSDANANSLPADFVAGTLTLLGCGYEADVALRPNGDSDLTINDWVMVGRILAGLEPPPAGCEFQRADTAPRSTLGNGQLDINDWVQAESTTSFVPQRSRPAASSAVNIPSSSPLLRKFAPASASPERKDGISILAPSGETFCKSRDLSPAPSAASFRKKPWVAMCRTRGRLTCLSEVSVACVLVSTRASGTRILIAVASPAVPGSGGK